MRLELLDINRSFQHTRCRSFIEQKFLQLCAIDKPDEVDTLPHSTYMSTLAILPQIGPAILGDSGAFAVVVGYKQIMVVEARGEHCVVIMFVTVDYGQLAVMLLHERDEHSHAVLHLLTGPTRANTALLHIEHGCEVLVGYSGMVLEIEKLQHSRRLGREEMVGAYQESGCPRPTQVLVVALVYYPVALGGFDIDKLGIGVCRHFAPQYVAIVLRHVYAVVAVVVVGVGAETVEEMLHSAHY